MISPRFYASFVINSEGIKRKDTHTSNKSLSYLEDPLAPSVLLLHSVQAYQAHQGVQFVQDCRLYLVGQEVLGGLLYFSRGLAASEP